MTERGERYQQMILQFKRNQHKDYIKAEIEPTGPRQELTAGSTSPSQQHCARALEQDMA